jgi:TonB family protein
MRFARLVLLYAPLLAAPAWSQVPDPNAARNAANWDIFLKLYPQRAIAAHEEGAVGFTVTLDNKGEVTRCQVTHTSGHPLLDEETCQLITLHAQFKPDSSLGSSQTETHEGVIAWKLQGLSTALAAPKPITLAAAPERIVCKKTLRAGTLAAFDRTCLPATEWAKQSDQQKEPWADLQGKKGATNGTSCVAPSGC